MTRAYALTWLGATRISACSSLPRSTIGRRIRETNMRTSRSAWPNSRYNLETSRQPKPWSARWRRVARSSIGKPSRCSTRYRRRSTLAPWTEASGSLSRELALQLADAGRHDVDQRVDFLARDAERGRQAHDLA